MTYISHKTDINKVLINNNFDSIQFIKLYYELNFILIPDLTEGTFLTPYHFMLNNITIKTVAKCYQCLIYIYVILIVLNTINNWKKRIESMFDSITSNATIISLFNTSIETIFTGFINVMNSCTIFSFERQ